MHRDGPCLPQSPAHAKCGQRFVYDWDEVGRLARARRWDLDDAGSASDAIPTSTAAADLGYAYDATDDRAIKSAVDAQGNVRVSLYPLDALELRGTTWSQAIGDYVRSSAVQVAYLLAHGVRLGRVAHADADLPSLTSGATHVFLELMDHLGSTGIVIDRDTSELVERSTYQGYGGAESDYRPERWKSFREDYRFTGKEEDVEVGLQYFGKRYYAPLLGRWVSADPLSVHELGADINVYAYVHARVLSATDPLGLADEGVPRSSVIEIAPVTVVGHPATFREMVQYSVEEEQEAAKAGVCTIPTITTPEGGGIDIPFDEQPDVKAIRQGYQDLETVAQSPIGATGAIGAAGQDPETRHKKIEVSVGVSGALAALGAVAANRADRPPEQPQKPTPGVGQNTGVRVGAGNGAGGGKGSNKSTGAAASSTTTGGLRPEEGYLGSKKHGVEWKDGRSLAMRPDAKGVRTPQGQWGSDADLQWAAQQAATLKPREANYFTLPAGHSSYVWRTDGTRVPANRAWLRNNGTGTFHGYPKE
jgi:RHS repeat-associated protein